MTLRLDNHDLLTAETLIADLRRLSGARCPGCQAVPCHHQVLMSIALGFKNAPHCLPCLGGALRQDPDALRESLLAYFQRRDCYRTAWDWATTIEAAEAGQTGSCPVAAAIESRPQSAPAPQNVTGPAARRPAARRRLTADAGWDAGDLGCGELVLDLRLRLEALRPGRVFKLIARDPGAPEDLPAWCRLTGHRLLRAEHPTYWIERKD